MKNLLKIFFLISLFGIALACNTRHKEIIVPAPVVPAPAEKSTVVYLVRHAEKGTNSATDPDLSAAGQARAQVLKDSLSHLPIAAIYTTDYKRTRQTAAPLAQAKNLTPILYQANDFTGIATRIRKDNLNQTVVVVGHSNTVLEILEALQAKRPVPQLTDSDYSYLFKVILKEGKEPQAEAMQYGL